MIHGSSRSVGSGRVISGMTIAHRRREAVRLVGQTGDEDGLDHPYPR
jgi:hypothetical protein